jgi:hypothetical protein
MRVSRRSLFSMLFVAPFLKKPEHLLHWLGPDDTPKYTFYWSYKAEMWTRRY